MDAAGIASVAKGAGLTDPEKLSIAVAIALAESGGNPQAHNSRPPDNSYGLWQINMLGALAAPRRKSFGITSNEQLYDPAINARAMMNISSNGSNFRPWTTFTSGAYIKHIQEARASTGVVASSGAVISQTGLEDFIPGGSELKAVTGGIIALGSWIGNRHNWIRVGYVGLGVGMLYISAAVVSKKSVGEAVKMVGGLKGAIPV